MVRVQQMQDIPMTSILPAVIPAYKALSNFTAGRYYHPTSPEDILTVNITTSANRNFSGTEFIPDHTGEIMVSIAHPRGGEITLKINGIAPDNKWNFEKILELKKI